MMDWTSLIDPAAIIEALDSLSRTRALTLDESLALEHAIKRERQNRRHNARYWSPEQDGIALDLKSRRAKVGVIAKRVGRSKDAVYARIRFLKLRELGLPMRRRG
jgi:post-segregation antitoxin (ccd killing protein)